MTPVLSLQYLKSIERASFNLYQDLKNFKYSLIGSADQKPADNHPHISLKSEFKDYQKIFGRFLRIT